MLDYNGIPRELHLIQTPEQQRNLTWLMLWTARNIRMIYLLLLKRLPDCLSKLGLTQDMALSSAVSHLSSLIWQEHQFFANSAWQYTSPSPPCPPRPTLSPWSGGVLKPPNKLCWVTWVFQRTSYRQGAAHKNQPGYECQLPHQLWRGSFSLSSHFSCSEKSVPVSHVWL